MSRTGAAGAGGVPEAGVSAHTRFPSLPAAWTAFAIAAAYGIVIAAITPFVTKDGPAHLYNALVLADWSSSRGAVFRPYFVVRSALGPGWLDHFLIQHLLAVLPPLGAEKALLWLSAAGIPLAAIYACAGVGRPQLGLLAAPFAGSFAFHMGFFGFSIGMAIALVLVGLWLRSRAQPTWGHAVVVALLALLVLWAHPIPFACALLVLAGPVAVDIATGRIRRQLPLVLAWVPACAAFAAWWVRQPTQTAGPVLHMGVLGRFAELLCIVPLWGYGWASALLTTIFAFVLWSLVYRAVRRRRTEGEGAPAGRGLGIGVVLLTAAALVAPDALAGGSILVLRLILTVPLFAVLWLATRPAPRGLQARAGLAGAAAALVLLAVQVPAYLQVSRRAREVIALGRRIPEGSTLIGWSTDYQPAGTHLLFLPLDHAVAYVATERHLALLDDYEPIERIFPVRFRFPADWAKNSRAAEYALVVGGECPRELTGFAEMARSPRGTAVLCRNSGQGVAAAAGAAPGTHAGRPPAGLIRRAGLSAGRR